MKRRCGALFVLAMLALTLTGCGAKPDARAGATQEAASTEPSEDAAETAQEGSLIIALDDLGETPRVIDWTQDGVAMQLIALKASDGTPRLAYNTCQVCAGSPYAYFEYQDGMLTCQNCGNAFPLSSVGIIAGGCNPMPTGGFEIQDGKIVLSAEELSRASASFKNWKAFQ